MQPFFVMLGLHAQGRSAIFDYRYPERIAYAEQLAKLYRGSVRAEHGKITVDGPGRPQAADVVSTDLRGSMALVMGALLAEGTSRVDKVQMALRGYDQLQSKLRGLGLTVDVVDDA
jgi:UDP-N-acetylglucosamine 1-carboxyvinyltransferase